MVLCRECDAPSDLVTGAEIYPHRRDLYEKKFYRCTECDAYAGCHPDGKPMGRPVGPETRRARRAAHSRFDKIWQSAPESYPGMNPKKAKQMARGRCYRWLAAQFQEDEVHIGWMGADEAWQVYRICEDVTYADIRKWVKAEKAKAKAN